MFISRMMSQICSCLQLWLLAILLLSFIPLSTSLRLNPSAIQAKNQFLDSLVQPSGLTTAALDRLVAYKDDTMAKYITNYVNKQTKGLWQVIYAPHVSTLSRLSLTNFEINYLFQGDNNLLSNVKYTSKIFGNGWLNARGKVYMEGNVCKIRWEKIWWEINTTNPSQDDDTERHTFASIIQAIGKLAFVEDFSVFPVQYLDNDMTVFLFPLFGTRICARFLRT
jgi:hypothetical protein